MLVTTGHAHEVAANQANQTVSEQDGQFVAHAHPSPNKLNHLPGVFQSPWISAA